MNQPRGQHRNTRNEVNGWVVFDKPVGMTSTHAVSRMKRIFNAKKAGHAGTLDPLASGILPIALGEATKTVPFVQDGEKAYRFTVRWGIQTNTDDTEGHPVAQSDARPDTDAVLRALPAFVGTIMQKPPAFSAIKVDGERAYDRARDGEAVELPPRPITIHRLDLIAVPSADEVVLEARCGKGTYVRAIARDLGLMLGCFGHVTALRRTRVGPFLEQDAVGLDVLDHPDGPQGLLSVEAGLSEVACVPVNRGDAVHLRRGQPLILRGHDAPFEGMAFAACGGIVVAFGPIEQGALQPHRVFNLPF
ncbi:tRNA pseudouridine(55) synthase TruB [Lichenihabitans sp. Uapishka_5]|uniref:tRNA pseudouridine(55) synthase TruB n=1 Tax=Lichenihabitans sp. Uapishka_5 TaxID=3037302 RepID=UPI0029E7E224|nr:tRNA pseudouridine(55) synthase TruB [Lichenihabitans sp. Uapishka_5]MDX7953145.1 tRNA pseudouridine(55) synthase TruB [Lichenihabitans sp. Uapishka_5]